MIPAFHTVCTLPDALKLSVLTKYKHLLFHCLMHNADVRNLHVITK